MLIKVCQKLDALLKIPRNLEEKVSISVLKDPNESYTTPTESDSDSEFFSESEKSDHETEKFERIPFQFLTRTPSPFLSPPHTPPRIPSPVRMAANYEYIRFVNSTLTEFDDIYVNLPRFRNQLNIIIAATEAADLALGFTLVRAKITDETLLARVAQAVTMQAILETVQDSIIRPDPQIIIDKIRAKQNTNPIKLAEEFKTLTNELTKAYVSQNIGIDNANRLATNVRSIRMFFKRMDLMIDKEN